MKTVTENLLARHELTGLKVEVVHSSNPFHMGIKGIVEEETKNTLVIVADYKKRRIPKEYVTYSFSVTNGKVITIKGERLLGRPVDRVKRTSRRSRS